MAFETLADLHQDGILPKDLTLEQAQKNYIKAANKGIIKVASKMGISTVQSYRGAQIFEAIGLAPELIDRYFTNTASRIKGVGLDVIAAESLARHRRGYPPIAVEGEVPTAAANISGGDGEYHAYNPDTVAKLQYSVRIDSFKAFQEYTALVNDESRRRATHLRACSPVQEGHADSNRSGRAGQGNRQAVRHRRHELRVDLQGGPREPGHRHEPHRR